MTLDLVLENRAADLVYENFDMALRYGRPEAQDIVVRRVGAVRRILVASPAFLERHGPIATLEQLGDVDLVVTPAILSASGRLALVGGGGAAEVEVRPVLKANDAHVIADTLLAGHAAGPVQQLLVADALRDGRLVRILPEWEVRATEMFLAYPSVRFMRPAVRAFADRLTAQLPKIEGVIA